MILMRMPFVKGMCEIHGYDDLKWEVGGWFPVSSVDFGFSDMPEPDKQKKTEPTQQEPSKNQKKEGCDLGITKSADGSTVHLMKQAVLARHKDKDPNIKKLCATEVDIHFVGSLRGANTDPHIFTFLMIHLEDITVKSWRLTGSGDDRPTENITIRYEKMSVAYHGTLDGKVQDAIELGGWQLGKAKDYAPQTEYFPYYPEKGPGFSL